MVIPGPKKVPTILFRLNVSKWDSKCYAWLTCFSIILIRCSWCLRYMPRVARYWDQYSSKYWSQYLAARGTMKRGNRTALVTRQVFRKDRLWDKEHSAWSVLSFYRVQWGIATLFWYPRFPNVFGTADFWKAHACTKGYIKGVIIIIYVHSLQSNRSK